MDFRSKTGSVAVYSLLSVTVFIALLFSLYLVVNARHKTQLKTAEDIRREAEQYIGDSEIEIVEDPEEIYIYQDYQNDKINSNDYVYIPEENKIYKFTTTAKYYHTFLKVYEGSVVYYDPTIGVLDNSKLTYTSPSANGNGVGNQTITATSADNKWVVLEKRNGKIVLISDDVKKLDNGSEFSFSGSTAYLYAEQELHNACSIYGHGNGVDKSMVTTPKIGHPDVDLTNGTPITSGARSLSMEDIESVSGIDTELERREKTEEQRGSAESWFVNTFKPYYMTKTLPTTNTVQMPTIAGYQVGRPTSTYFNIGTDIGVARYSIFRPESYWLSHRYGASHAGSDYTDARIAFIGYDSGLSKEGISGEVIARSYETGRTSITSAKGLRPIVVLDHSVKFIPEKNLPGFEWRVVQ